MINKLSHKSIFKESRVCFAVYGFAVAVTTIMRSMLPLCCAKNGDHTKRYAPGDINPLHFRSSAFVSAVCMLRATGPLIPVIIWHSKCREFSPELVGQFKIRFTEVI